MRSLPPSQLQSEICSFITSITGQPCGPRDDLKALGIDSIAFLEVVIFIEKTLLIPLPLELITSQPITTVEALVSHLRSPGSSQQSTDA